MKTILVDADKTFVVGGKVDTKLFNLLSQYKNNKIIVTNANDEQLVGFSLVDMPYIIYTLKHNPNKTDPEYFRRMSKDLNLFTEDVVYFEHNVEAVKSAESVGIKSYHFDHEERDLEKLKNFLDKNI